MNQAVSTGFCIIDASTAMEGEGPSSGTLVDMGLIIAGTSPLAADMVGATLMGFRIDEVPHLVLAHQSGMTPVNLTDIEILGAGINECRRSFVRPNVVRWTDINKIWGVREV
jgi:uncharacterized protein (DUF362 family)